MDLKAKSDMLSDEEIRSILQERIDQPFIPASTYRLQLNKDFTFRQAAEVIPYLAALGAHAVYCSPYFASRPGSLHGYDVADPHRLNPEIGTEKDYERFCAVLRQHGMKQILDIVPNHMGIIGNNNPLWDDVLENGPSSPYARFFDIDWNPKKTELKDKVLLPFLGDLYGRVLENQEIKLEFLSGLFSIVYAGHRFPVAPETYPRILEYGIEFLKHEIKDKPNELREYLSIITAFQNLPARTERDPDRLQKRRREKEIAKSRLAGIAGGSPNVRAFLESRIELFNGNKEDPKSFDLLDDLLAEQAYRLAHWRVAVEEINYRRFFDINELAAIRMEDQEVFEFYHYLVFELIRQDKVHGLRVDHPDGLYNPPEYFRRLQDQYLAHCVLGRFSNSADESAQAPLEPDRELLKRVQRILGEKPFQDRNALYVVAEKILDRKEALPADWRVHGTVGYDYSSALDGLFVDLRKSKQFDDIYEHFAEKKFDLDQLIYERKKFFALVHMASEINNLASRLDSISEHDRRYRDFTLYHFTVAIREVIACFPVYRTYISSDTPAVSGRDQKYIHIAIEKAKRRTPALPRAVYDFLRDVLLLKLIPEGGRGEERLYRDFILRFQQLTGPIMAKGLEDTAFYIFNRLISLNEVGSDFSHFGISAGEFHRLNMERNKQWPANMLASSTHDSKRSADVRMRIHALSEAGDEWSAHLARWSKANEKHKTEVDGVRQPDKNTEYFIYQTLIGAWPHGRMDAKMQHRFRARMRRYFLKAVREAKIETTWIDPNAPYEEAVQKFAEKILTPGESNRFLKSFLPFQRKMARFGMYNSLSALVLGLGSPGVTDIYQGNEVWNLALVDPDNRQPVDYGARRKVLQGFERALRVKRPATVMKELLASSHDGRIKLFLMTTGLGFRRAQPDLFIGGQYVPLKAAGKKEKNIVAFLRQAGGKAAVVCAGRFFSEVVSYEGAFGFRPALWQKTRILLPKDFEVQGGLKNIFTGAEVYVRREGKEKFLIADDVFDPLCAAILTNA